MTKYWSIICFNPMDSIDDVTSLGIYSSISNVIKKILSEQQECFEELDDESQLELIEEWFDEIDTDIDTDTDLWIKVREEYKKTMKIILKKNKLYANINAFDNRTYRISCHTLND